MNLIRAAAPQTLGQKVFGLAVIGKLVNPTIQVVPSIGKEHKVHRLSRFLQRLHHAGGLVQMHPCVPCTWPVLYRGDLSRMRCMSSGMAGLPG